ncbi:hypothetical protein [Fluviicola chungangensis]|uniref:DUF4293 family protein n=1 Tax=Fluviicola chungangensis TaxID=2597671 RepID=A0A556N2U8_9FLAO|nr:hypothetical protein [Fluviicola chungangensis]TSJ46526.1 hypothetical protein FO442_05025 [Fluviicola chungangensis]
MKKSFIKILSITIFIFICCSLFLPQYETLTDGMMDDSFSFMSEYPNPDQSGGFFGGGYYTTFNGFGSTSAILNTVVSFFITIMLLNGRLSRKVLLFLFILMMITLLLSLLDIVIAPTFLNESDKLKIGFYALRVLELALFYFAYAELKRLHKTKIERSDLIDNFQ